MGRFFKVNLPKGLTAKELIAALVAVAKRGVEGTETKEKSSETETASASENLSDQDKKDVAAFRSVGAGLRNFNPLLGGSGGAERSAAPVVRESYDYINHIFMSLPQKMTLSENFTSFLEHLELITEDFDDLDKVLTNFAKIKTDVDDKLEKATQSTKDTKNKTATTPTASTADSTTATPIKDVQLPDIQAAVAAKIPQEQVATINEKIAALDVDDTKTVNNIETAKAFLTNYKTFLEKDAELKQLAELAGLPELVTENKRQKLVNKLKKIILEQLKEEAEISQEERAAAVAPSSVPSVSGQTGVTAPAATTQAQTQELARQLHPKIKQYLENLNAKTYQEMLAVLSKIPPSESGVKYQLGNEEDLAKQIGWIQHFAKPETNNQEFVKNIKKITTIGDLRGKVIDSQIAKMNVPGITNRQTYKQYKSIIDNIDNISKLITILKTGGTPGAAPAPAAAPPAAPTTAAQAPAATATPPAPAAQ
jgi:hypothetical protein